MSPSRIRLAVILGTRPEAVKLAPVILAAQARPDQFELSVVSTGQHREMLDAMLSWFKITPHVDLGIMQKDQAVMHVANAALQGLGDWLAANRPDWVVVQGDTTTTFMGALAAFYNQIPVAHVEAGLRTGDKYSPYPEEMNRALTGRLADLHFAPTSAARENLLREGIAEHRIHVTGNTGIDALLLTLAKTGYRQHARPQRPHLLVTTHRRENHGAPLQNICGAIHDLLECYPALTVQFPVHLSPKVRSIVRPSLGQHDRVELCEPLDYPDFVVAMARATLILTDSGGVQEEAPSLGKPVLVLREATERPEAVQAGTAIIVGTDRQRIVNETRRLIDDPVAYERMARALNPFGDGRAANRILDALAECAPHAPVRNSASTGVST